MRRIGFELTDRCNLACTHCLRSINHDRANVNTAVVRAALLEAANLGFEETVFTGGEPTLHPDFISLAEDALLAGLQLTVVTNGQRPEPLWEVYRQVESVKGFTVALSLEGADEATFNLVRGKHAYRRFMQTVLGLQARQINVRFSATIGPWNREQLGPILTLAHDLSVDGVSLAAYQPTMRDKGIMDTDDYADLVQAMEAAARSARVPVILSYEPLTDRATHQCSTLSLEDLNVNHLGQLTFCCQLSSLYQSPNPDAIVVGELKSLDVAGAVAAQLRSVATFLEKKLHAWREGPPQESDRHPCSYCLRVFGQHTEGRIQHAA